MGLFFFPPFFRFVSPFLFGSLVLCWAAFLSFILLLVLFPQSYYLILVFPFLIQLFIMVKVFSQPTGLVAFGGLSTRTSSKQLHEFGRKLNTILRLGVIITGYALSYSNWGTIPSTVAFTVTTVLALHFVWKEGSKWARIERIEKKGYTFADLEGRIEAKGEGEDKRFYLMWKGHRVPLDKSELPLLYEYGELHREGKMRDLPSLVGRIHDLRVGFEKDGWMISPSGQPGVYTMYKGDLADMTTISRRDAAWLARSTMNKPDELLLASLNTTSRSKVYAQVTKHLKNVTYAGNHAVISTRNGRVYVDLRDGKVYKEDDWNGLDSGFVCIVPTSGSGMREDNLVVPHGGDCKGKYCLEWQDAIILSKIFNISRETFPVRELLK